jgi:UDP-3-O-[3-hydroxymyristoyl] glucosamine N-acyltransferase
MSQVLNFFAKPMPSFYIEIHPTAVIDKTAVIGVGTKIALCYIGPKVKIGEMQLFIQTPLFWMNLR